MPKRNAPEIPARQSVRLPFRLDSLRELRVQRADGEEVDTVRVEGHASVTGFEYDVWGGPPYGWIETIDPDAFDETLADDPDVVFLLNHSGMSLARTKSATLELESDDVGLRVRADLDPANPDVQGLSSAIGRGDIDEMSFAFRVTEQIWAEHPDWEGDEMSLRTITKINLHRGDVCAVNFGASDVTDIDLLRSLERLGERELVEARAVIDRRLAKKSDAPPGGMPGENARGGMPPDVLALLKIPSNPLLEEYAREPRADQGSAGAAG